MRAARSALLLAALAAGAPAHGAALVVGYVDLAGDARYRESRTYARYLSGPLGRPYAGAEVALAESKFVGSALGIGFSLARETVKDTAGAVAAIEAMHAEGVRHVLLDAPAEVVAGAAAGLRALPLLLFNVSARDDDLRNARCQRNLLHVIPSHAMLADALAQFLVFRKWREVLVLRGPAGEDRQMADAFARAAKRMGLDIVATRDFVLSNDPRERDRNNIALLTAGEDYDVVFVADGDGEFARGVPYRGVQPRPVVGSEGLAAAAWHWAWERHGAPQLEGRFEKRQRRPMRGEDWAAWMAVKAVVEAVVRSGSTDFATVSAALRGDDIILDGFKGHRLNFRPWNGQLRQPVLLVTHNWVVDRAPIKGFLHRRNNLDTLGFDEGDSQCGR